MNLNKKSMIVKCEEVEGIKTQFGSEVKMLMHPALMDLGRDVSVLWVTLPPPKHQPGPIAIPIRQNLSILFPARDTRSGQEKIRVKAKMLVFNPPGLDHNVKNTGKATMYLLRFHVPSLPKEDLIGKCIEAAKRLSKI